MSSEEKTRSHPSRDNCDAGTCTACISSGSPPEARPGESEDGSVGFELRHGGKSLGAVTLCADGGVEIVLAPRAATPAPPGNDPATIAAVVAWLKREREEWGQWLPADELTALIADLESGAWRKARGKDGGR